MQLTFARPPGGPRRHRQGSPILRTLIRLAGIKDSEYSVAIHRGRKRDDRSQNSGVCLGRQPQPCVGLRMDVEPA